MNIVDLIGWVATATFVGSYFCARPAALRRTQMVGAIIWAIYGVMLHATPVIVANVLVVMAALWTAPRHAGSGAVVEQAA